MGDKNNGLGVRKLIEIAYDPVAIVGIDFGSDELHVQHIVDSHGCVALVVHNQTNRSYHFSIFDGYTGDIGKDFGYLVDSAPGVFKPGFNEKVWTLSQAVLVAHGLMGDGSVKKCECEACLIARVYLKGRGWTGLLIDKGPGVLGPPPFVVNNRAE